MNAPTDEACIHTLLARAASAFLEHALRLAAQAGMIEADAEQLVAILMPILVRLCAWQACRVACGRR